MASKDWLDKQFEALGKVFNFTGTLFVAFVMGSFGKIIPVWIAIFTGVFLFVIFALMSWIAWLEKDL